VSYFTAVVAREGRKWAAHDVDVEAVDGLADLAVELRDTVTDDDAPVLLLVEREDAWWGVVRVDGEDDPRVFVSDAAGAAASPYASILDVAVEVPQDDDDDVAAVQAACAGDFDVLDDLGVSPEQLQDMCDEELLPMDALAVVAEGAGFAEVLDSLR
jgi:putative tRNA adenosine deaminase-associated protein